MNLWRFLDEKNVVLDVRSTDRMEALVEIMSAIPHNGRLRNKDRALRELLDRERLSTTGIGGGFAVPHVFTEEANLPTLIFARSKAGIDFEAKDGKPVHVLVLAFANPRKKNFFIQCLYHIVQLLRDPDVFERLKQAEEKTTILEVFGYKKEAASRESATIVHEAEEMEADFARNNPHMILGSFLARTAAEVSA